MVKQTERLKCTKETHYNKMKELDDPEKLVSAQLCAEDTKEIYDKVVLFNEKYEIFEKVSLEASREKGGCKKNKECNEQRKVLDSLVSPMVDAVHKYQKKCGEEDFQRVLKSAIAESMEGNKNE